MRLLAYFFACAGSVLATAWTQEAWIHSPPLVAQIRMTSVQYETISAGLVKEGYKLSYFSGYTINDDPRFAAIWERVPANTSSPSWIARHSMNSFEYQKEFDRIVGQGYRLTLVNGYTVKDEDRYVAIWEKSTGPFLWVARHGMNAIDLQITFNGLVVLGYRMTHISGYAIGNQAHYAAIWELKGKKVKGLWTTYAGMTARMFQERTDILSAHGYTLIDVCGYGVNDVDFYAAIWDQSRMAGSIVRHGMSDIEYQAELERNTNAGYKLAIVDGYTVNNTDLYAALWVKT
jgi:Bacterial tandem repeat domain 1